ncbi:AAL082Wp [Eremothecium gossypii ATCC 10895]|uniref:Mediator of RNA polymerase II transcription subunit 20 n=1 Tax=Eremothecium gossypii (strain ATCC 10895 / CBS 109.51 / FGSC 9923 / NRRL Y-1056) TaxID=284811 RepID=MED20_EREGS|nr:AAL082Wp [Eremothecium gossypii ATCC 10895]Q75F10.1 RecName: Full=Mediator of RNA polymerase II transcription subunit 20; AltName: Full=Mediator complex subunit 20 [Eremothecium gossypii ATCC 10895]AAS50284.1 AAL082Wp [Eremothecium gossypii ATCC 10895]AEY94570.1 FAAL082Wp [Eremothecium gossypii FDAG1]
MKRTAVIFIEKATPSTITQFHDILSTHVLAIQEKWSFELKTFRSSIKNLPPSDTKVLYSLQLTHRDNQTVVIKNQSAIVTGQHSTDALTSNGCSSGFPEPFDNILTSKLSNIWTQRQSTKGNFGTTYKTSELIIRASNVFSSSGFKGLLLEIECTDPVSAEEFDRRVANIRAMLSEIDINDYKLNKDEMNEGKPVFLCDLAYQYVKVLD